MQSTEHRAYRKASTGAGNVGGQAYLRAQIIDKGNGDRARQQHPDPDLPPDVLQGNATGKDGDEAEEPFAKGTRGTSQMAEFQRCDLERRISRVSASCSTHIVLLFLRTREILFHHAEG